ncbi:MAG: WYL domain-containing transcriptional regulator [Alphaproteobacteria bacterium]|nr:WYL domain-containing transcriptional regulator [Alphaproteobacteria bacterium]
MTTTLNKAQKLVKMVELMNRRGGIRATEFMDHFELDPRTLRRYLADLRGLNLPVEDNGTGFDRTIALDPSYRRAGVQLTLPEVLSLHFGRTLFTFLDGTQFATDLDDAIERLQPAIPRAHADVARDLDRRFIAVAEHAKDYREMGDIIDEVITALIYNNPSSAEYVKPDGSAKRYELEPYTLATYRQGLYLFARDVEDNRVKTFAIERFVGFRRHRTQKFEIPADYTPSTMVDDSFGIISGPMIELVATFDASVAPYVRERRWHDSQQMEGMDDGRVRLSMRVGMSQELISWLLGFGGAVKVEGPDSLIEVLRDAHKRALERFDD